MTTTGSKVNKILSYLDELFPNPKCELTYNKDYEFLIAIVLSAQTTDKRVNQVTPILFNRYPSLESLSKANLTDLEQIIKPIGTFKKKAIFVKEIATKLLVDNYQSIPNDRTYLESLSGVGRKTANVFLSNIYAEPAIAVDTHVSRISKRLKLANIQDEPLTIEQKLMKKIPRDKWSRTHHQLVLFGRYYCKAKSPECQECQLQELCREYKKRISK